MVVAFAKAGVVRIVPYVVVRRLSLVGVFYVNWMYLVNVNCLYQNNVRSYQSTCSIVRLNSLLLDALLDVGRLASRAEWIGCGALNTPIPEVGSSLAVVRGRLQRQCRSTTAWSSHYGR